MRFAPIRVVTAALAAGILASLPAAAGNPVTYNLTGTVQYGLYAGEMGTGSFSYPSTSINGGFEEIDTFEGLELEFTIFGQTFHETDDSSYDVYPRVYLQDGTPIAVDFGVDESGKNPTQIDQALVGAILMNSDLTPSTSGGFEADVFITYTNVPEPSTYAGVFGFGAVGWGLLRRRCR